MPKMKTHKATKKRVTIRNSGSVKRSQTHKSHLKANKTHKRVRQSRKATGVHPSDMKRIREQLTNLL